MVVDMARSPASPSKHTVYLPADVVKELQERAIVETGSSYGAVQSFLRRAVRKAIADFRGGEKGAGKPTISLEVRAAHADLLEKLDRYLDAPAASDAEQETKRSITRIVNAWAAEKR